MKTSLASNVFRHHFWNGIIIQVESFGVWRPTWSRNRRQKDIEELFRMILSMIK